MIARLVFFGLGSIFGALFGAIVGDVFACFYLASFVVFVSTIGSIFIPDSLETNEFAF